MDIVLHAFEGVFTVSLMVLAGYYLGSHHWFSDESLNLISKLITKICLPLYMIVNLTETLTHDTVIQMSSGLPVAVSSMIICFIVGQLVVRFANIPRGRRGVLAAVFFVTNTILIGLPLSTELFGTKCIPFVLVYYMANTVVFWVVAAHIIAVDGSEKVPPLFSLQTLKHIGRLCHRFYAGDAGAAPAAPAARFVPLYGQYDDAAGDAVYRRGCQQRGLEQNPF